MRRNPPSRAQETARPISNAAVVAILAFGGLVGITGKGVHYSQADRRTQELESYI